MSDKGPNQRFAMIALELELADGTDPLAGVVLTEQAPAASPGQLDVLRVNADGSIACPRCGLSAFESDVANRVVCRGCPPPAPSYEAPYMVWFGLRTERYRCDACGRQSRVSMTLSEVNLYCGGCSRLAIHTKQTRVVDKLGGPKLTTEARQTVEDLVERYANSVSLAPSRRSIFIDEINDVLLPDNDPMLVKLTAAMMSILKLEDFDEYAARRRMANQSSDGPRVYRDIERRTGRTWRGIIELMARHYLATTRPIVWVVGGSEREDLWLRNEVTSIRNELGNDHPTKIVVPRAFIKEGTIDQIIRRETKVPAGVMLFVDHTYYERRGRRGGFARIVYKPDF